MASLFDDLPAAKREGDAQPAAAPPASAPDDGDDADAARPGKRARVGGTPPSDPQPAPEEPPPHAADAGGGAPGDQVAAALERIAGHISNPSKFAKASALLRQLMESGTLTKAHRRPAFAALKAAFADPARATDPALRREYARLIRGAAALQGDVWGRHEVAQLEVYCLWADWQNQLFTDDSFVLNKVLGELKARVAALADATEEEEAAAEQLVLPAGAPAARLAPLPTSAAAGGGAGEAEAEADPFGLDAFLAQHETAAAGGDGGAGRAPRAPPAEPRATWTRAELGVMRAQALLDCVATAKAHLHRLPWARTSVELFIEAAYARCGAFVAQQRAALGALHAFVVQQRALRRTRAARGADDPGTDMTAFERARAEWGTQVVAARGAVGASGESGGNIWLG